MKSLRIVLNSVLATMLFIALLSSCSATDKFEDCVTAGNCADAISVYQEKISGNTGKEREAQDFMWSYISNTLSDYAEGKIDTEEAENAFNCLSQINNQLAVLGADFNYLYGELDVVRASKENFEKATTMSNRKDYEAAAELFLKVNESDIENYEKAQEQLKLCYMELYQDVNTTIDQYIAQTEFELAIQTYENFFQRHEELISDELTQKAESCRSEYRRQIIEKSINIYHESGADAADAVIVRGLQLLEDDQALINVSNLYQSVSEPVSFKQLTGREEWAGTFGADKTDSMGKNHSSKNLIYFFSLGRDRPSASIERNTYGSYSTLRGDMFFLDTDYDTAASMKIYADGEVVFDSGAMNKKTGGTSFDIDILGVYSVKIELSYIDLGFVYSPCFLDNVFVSRTLKDEEIWQAALD